MGRKIFQPADRPDCELEKAGFLSDTGNRRFCGSD